MPKSSEINPFEQHPESEPLEKKLNDILTLQQVRKIITNKMIEIKTIPTPRWGYNKHYVVTILAGLITELEEKCQHN